MGKCIKGVNGMRRESGERGGWSAIVFFAIFINRHYSVFSRSGIFYETNSKKSANLAACAAKFSLSKKHRDLKN